MALKKSDLYASLWKSCDELRGGMDASQYKDYILTLLFVKYVSDKAKAEPDSAIAVPPEGSFDAMLEARGKPDIGDRFNKIVSALAKPNELEGIIDQTDWADEERLGKGKEMVDRLSQLVAIFSDLDFAGSRAQGDDLLGDAYEYLMRHFATESGKSKGQFYTPAEVSRVLAKIVGISAATKRSSTTVYDPTCGSGSLLLKVAAEVPRKISLYGQEKDNATWALCRMNTILHGYDTAWITKGDTITSPSFFGKPESDQLPTFDFIVANPPFSHKSWRNGLPTVGEGKEARDKYGRFEWGTPPEKNGDYAFLLHVLKSLNSTGKAAIILPHGVLFRGNAEAAIRKQLLKRGYIKGVIGLPANLFYGTGIPACIVVLDKENAQARTGVFMIDASKGFAKDGNKSRLRHQDIHKIVDTFNRQIEWDRYSRMVPLAEIIDPRNDYNLNISRYIDSSEPEDLQDLGAHIHGGIPDRDIGELSGFWQAFPQLRSQLFTPNRPGYSDLKLEISQVQQAILESAEFREFADAVVGKVAEWFAAHRKRLLAIDSNTRVDELITAISDDLLARFKPVALLDEYDVYDQLMGYWDEVMHDDVYLVMNQGWLGAAKPRRTIASKERSYAETPDLVVGSGRGAVKYKMDLIPPALIVARYFAAEQSELQRLEADAEEAGRDLEGYVEEHAGEEGALAEAMEDGRTSKVLASKRLKIARYEGTDPDEIKALERLIELYNAEAVAKREVKEAQEKLDLATLAKYGQLSETEAQELVLDDKWFAAVNSAIASEVNSLTLGLVARVRELGERYGETVGALEAELATLGAKMSGHLSAMGVR